MVCLYCSNVKGWTSHVGGQDNKVEHALILQQVGTVDENGQPVTKGTKVGGALGWASLHLLIVNPTVVLYAIVSGHGFTAYISLEKILPRPTASRVYFWPAPTNSTSLSPTQDAQSMFYFTQ